MDAENKHEKLLSAFTTEALLQELERRSGPSSALAQAALLFERKGKDYNTGLSRDSYFPMGLASYAQMIHVKSQRLLSFAMSPRLHNFEGPRDTLLDLISYAAFGADWLARMHKPKEEEEEQPWM